MSVREFCKYLFSINLHRKRFVIYILSHSETGVINQPLHFADTYFFSSADSTERELHINVKP